MGCPDHAWAAIDQGQLGSSRSTAESFGYCSPSAEDFREPGSGGNSICAEHCGRVQQREQGIERAVLRRGQERRDDGLPVRLIATPHPVASAVEFLSRSTGQFSGGCRCPTDYRCDFIKRKLEHVVQYECDALRRRHRLQYHDEGKPNGIGEQCFKLWINNTPT